jgi:hypothetical protein
MLNIFKNVFLSLCSKGRKLCIWKASQELTLISCNFFLILNSYFQHFKNYWSFANSMSNKETRQMGSKYFWQILLLSVSIKTLYGPRPFHVLWVWPLLMKRLPTPGIDLATGRPSVHSLTMCLKDPRFENCFQIGINYRAWYVRDDELSEWN